MRNNRTLVHGWGVNDANYGTSGCPFFNKWSNMIRRAYGKDFDKMLRTEYDNVLICEDWKYFSNFKKWMETKEWAGMELDKDLKIPGNKKYSPETCIFIPAMLNKIITKKKKNKSILMQGVSQRTNRYRAMLNIYGINTHVGYFDTELEAHIAYSERKIKYLQEFIGKYNEEISLSLINYIKEYKNYVSRIKKDKIWK